MVFSQRSEVFGGEIRSGYPKKAPPTQNPDNYGSTVRDLLAPYKPAQHTEGLEDGWLDPAIFQFCVSSRPSGEHERHGGEPPPLRVDEPVVPGRAFLNGSLSGQTLWPGTRTPRGL